MITSKIIYRGQCNNCGREMPLLIQNSFYGPTSKKPYVTFIHCEDCSNAIANLHFAVMEEHIPHKYDMDEITSLAYKDQIAKFKKEHNIKQDHDRICFYSKKLFNLKENQYRIFVYDFKSKERINTTYESTVYSVSSVKRIAEKYDSIQKKVENVFIVLDTLNEIKEESGED